VPSLDCNTLQHTATHCNTLQHTATHCNTQQLISLENIVPSLGGSFFVTAFIGAEGLERGEGGVSSLAPKSPPKKLPRPGSFAVTDGAV